MNQALTQSRAELAHHDTNRDLYNLRNRIHRMTEARTPASEIAAVVGLTKRSVTRHRQHPTPPERPRLYNGAEVSDQRAEQLEQAAAFTLELAAVLREEDPTCIWGALTRLSHRQLQELAVIALAAIPIDYTADELLAWVMELPAAREQR